MNKTAEELYQEHLYLLEKEEFIDKKDLNLDKKQEDIDNQKKVVDEKTAEVNAYSEESKKQFMPTAKLDGSDYVLGRECNVFKIGVGGKNNSAYYYYYADKVTGICLKLEVKHTALGQEVPHNTQTFVCTSFITENVQDLSALI